MTTSHECDTLLPAILCHQSTAFGLCLRCEKEEEGSEPSEVSLFDCLCFSWVCESITDPLYMYMNENKSPVSLSSVNKTMTRSLTP